MKGLPGFAACVAVCACACAAFGEDEAEAPKLSFSADAAFNSKYVWSHWSHCARHNEKRV